MTIKGTPWIVDSDPDLGATWFSVWTNVPDAVNAEVAGRIGLREHANVLAAAPDLLVALIEAVQDLQDWATDHEEPGEPFVVTERVLAQARTAIAKARAVETSSPCQHEIIVESETGAHCEFCGAPGSTSPPVQPDELGD